MLKGLALVVLISLPSIAIGQTVTTTYNYDALGRLVGSATVVGTTTTAAEIQYDPAGNRRNYKVTGAANGAGGSDPGASVPVTRRYVVVPLNGFTLIPVG